MLRWICTKFGDNNPNTSRFVQCTFNHVQRR